MNTEVLSTATSGSRTSIRPRLVATPRPPRKRSVHGHRWPAMAAMPPSVWPMCPVPAQRARSTPQLPLAASSASTARPYFQPRVRRTFVAPMLPLPCWRMSWMPAERATSSPLGIDPTRYAAMSIATRLKLHHASDDLLRGGHRQVRRRRLAPGEHLADEPLGAGGLLRELGRRPAAQPTHLLGQVGEIPQPMVRAEQQQVGPSPQHILETDRHLGLDGVSHLGQPPGTGRSDLLSVCVVVAQHTAERASVAIDHALHLFGRLV